MKVSHEVPKEVSEGVVKNFAVGEVYKSGLYYLVISPTRVLCLGESTPEYLSVENIKDLPPFKLSDKLPVGTKVTFEVSA